MPIPTMISEIELANASSFLVDYFRSNDTKQFSKKQCLLSNNKLAENILYSSVMVLVMLSSIIGQSLVVFAVIMSRQLRNRVTMYFVASLACSDFILAVFQIPFKITTKLHGDSFCHDLGACYIMLMTDVIGNVASILNLLLIAIDRFIAIKLPFRYIEMLSSGRAKKLIGGVWVFATFWSCLQMFLWESDKIKLAGTVLAIKVEKRCFNINYYFYVLSFCGIYIPVLIIMTITYLTILHIALDQIKAIGNEVIVPTYMNSLLVGNEKEAEKLNKRRKRTFYRELRATKSVAMVYLAFIICWLPGCVINVLILFNNNYFKNMQQHHEVLFLFIFYFFLEVLPSVTAMVNPFIYCFSNKQFRFAFKQVCYKMIGKSLNERKKNASNRFRNRYIKTSLTTSVTNESNLYAINNNGVETIMET